VITHGLAETQIMIPLLTIICNKVLLDASYKIAQFWLRSFKCKNYIVKFGLK